MVGLESWGTLCCCLRWRLCFLLRRWNYCSREEGYARATLRPFLLLGVVFSSPSKQRNAVFLFSSASMPPIAAISFSRKNPCVGVSSSVACSPSFPSGSKNRMFRGAFRKVVVAKRLHMYSPSGKSVVFFRRFVSRCGNFLQTVFGQFPTKGFVLLAFGYHLNGVPHDGFSFPVLETSRRFDVQLQPSKFFETRGRH